MVDILLVVKTGLKTYMVNSISKRKRDNIITKNNWYEVYKTNLDFYSCGCKFMQEYNFDMNKVCKHIREVENIEREQLEQLKCNLADKPLDYDIG